MKSFLVNPRSLKEGLKELKLAAKQHKRDVERAYGSPEQWWKEKNKVLLPGIASLAVAGASASPAVSLLVHGQLKPSTMIATTLLSAGILPTLAGLKHLRDIYKIHQKRVRIKKIGLKESYHTTLKGYGKNSEEVEIHKNPSRNQLHKLLHQSEFKRLRGLLSQEGNSYVWDAGSAPHFHVEDELGFRAKDYLKVDFFKWKDGNIHISQEYYPAEMNHHIKNHPWVQKTLPNATIFQA